MNEFILNDIVFKKYDDTYYVSEYGDVYSKFLNSTMLHEITYDGHHRVQIHGKHKFVHRLVYELFVGPLIEGMQINHKDDNKNNNHYTNLYQGTQRENYFDCVNNSHFIGNVKSLYIYDSKLGYVLKFNKIVDFINYSGHSCLNGSFTKIGTKKWFKERYVVLNREYQQFNPDYVFCPDNINTERVTTMGDECNPVER